MQVNLISPICDTGYGIAGLNLLTSLVSNGIKVSLFPIGNPQFHSRFKPIFDLSINEAQFFNKDAPCIRLWHQNNMSMFVGGEKIGFPIFELNQFSLLEKHHLSSCDRLLVCSKWGKEVIEKNGINVTTNVLPLGVNTEIFTPAISKRQSTIFLNIGKWEIRKGHDILVKAFNAAFNHNDNVELWVLAENLFYNQQQNDWWASYYKESELGYKIRILPRQSYDFDVAEIMRQADCGVFPIRAEGWNLEALEMLACGKMLIASNYSGHTEFLSNENAYLIEPNDSPKLVGAIDSCELHPNGYWFNGHGEWMHFGDNCIEQLSNYMRAVHDLKLSGKLKINEAGLETANKYTWDKMSQNLIDIL